MYFFFVVFLVYWLFIDFDYYKINLYLFDDIDLY